MEDMDEREEIDEVDESNDVVEGVDPPVNLVEGASNRKL